MCVYRQLNTISSLGLHLSVKAAIHTSRQRRPTFFTRANSEGRVLSGRNGRRVEWCRVMLAHVGRHGDQTVVKKSSERENIYSLLLVCVYRSIKLFLFAILCRLSGYSGVGFQKLQPALAADDPTVSAASVGSCVPALTDSRRRGLARPLATRATTARQGRYKQPRWSTPRPSDIRNLFRKRALERESY